MFAILIFILLLTLFAAMLYKIIIFRRKKTAESYEFNSGSSIYSSNQKHRKLDIIVEGYGHVCNTTEIHNIITGVHPLAEKTACPSRNWIIPFIDSIKVISNNPTVIVVGTSTIG